MAESGGVPANSDPYSDRTDEAGRPIPHACFKVPTGGGKTLLAAATQERLNRQTGLTLWITPTNAIYEQTKAALKNREHTYRQMLERASGGRVKFMEKDDPFNRSDAANYLCVMLLSLPAARRDTNREFLKMFRDSGRYPTFFPDSDDTQGHARLLDSYPDLERAENGGPVKQSLYNVFKMLRPVVVLDEAHKAYGSPTNASGFVGAINRLSPSMVIELSATPNRNISNLLVDIEGTDLKQEEMIKLPVQVASYPTADWQTTLTEAAECLDRLEAEARSLENSEGRYIRPIAVVRVERTGNDQRDGERVHAEDVREYLTMSLAVANDAVRVKSSVNDELGRENLLSPLSPVRWVITKNALMEGWDCPFAYVLVMLDNTRAQRAITQLVGRVMRQPHAHLTNRGPLNQCYVYCWNINVEVAVNQVKNGLEQEGLTGLGDEVMGQAAQLQCITVQRRERFRGRNIFLPLVLHQDGDHWIELDYQSHILPHIDWASITEPDPQGSLPNPAQRQTASVDVGDAPPIFHEAQDLFIDKALKVSWFARRLSDVTPNAWQASRIARQLVDRLRKAGETDEQIYDQRSYLASTLREHVKATVEARAEQIFLRKFKDGELRFDLEAGQPNFRMVESYEIPISINDPTLQRYGQPLQLSLFEPIFSRQFDNELERKFAFYLDEQKALEWWHRVAVRQKGEYYLRGWKQERIWPDFVAMANGTVSKPQMLVFETKGEHLLGNSDTDYKRRVLDTLERAFNDHGKMTVRDGPVRGIFRLIFDENEFPDLDELKGSYNI